MTLTVVVAGTDTGVGKTIFCAALAGALAASYWKPIQAGLEGETDSETVRRLSGDRLARIHPEAYRFKKACSPHEAAEAEGVVIDARELELPRDEGTLIVEPAGGLMVPISRGLLQIDIIEMWHAPVVLCARTSLGTINHSLLSIEALRLREIPILGLAFIGEENRETERVISEFSGVSRLGRLDHVNPLDASSLAAAFSNGFDLAQIAIAGSRAA